MMGIVCVSTLQSASQSDVKEKAVEVSCIQYNDEENLT